MILIQIVTYIIDIKIEETAIILTFPQIFKRARITQ